MKTKEVLIYGIYLNTYRNIQILENVFCRSWNSILTLSQNECLVGGNNNIYHIKLNEKNQFYIDFIINDSRLENIFSFYLFDVYNLNKFLIGNGKGELISLNIEENKFYIKDIIKTQKDFITGMTKIDSKTFATCSYDESLNINKFK